MSLLALLLVTACSLDGDRGLLLWVTNQTGEVITIRYEAPGRERSLGTIGPGETLSEGTIFRELKRCGGPFVATRDDGSVVKVLQELCPNVPHTIREVDLSPSPSAAAGTT